MDQFNRQCEAGNGQQWYLGLIVLKDEEDYVSVSIGDTGKGIQKTYNEKSSSLFTTELGRRNLFRTHINRILKDQGCQPFHLTQ
ncbi:MAG: hypothetical protein U0T81_13480 [Saprospiraceae bacterium]